MKEIFSQENNSDPREEEFNSRLRTNFSKLNDDLTLRKLKELVRYPLYSKTRPRYTKKWELDNAELIEEYSELIEFLFTLEGDQIGNLTRILNALMASKILYAKNTYPKLHTIHDVRLRSKEELRIYEGIGPVSADLLEYVFGNNLKD